MHFLNNCPHLSSLTNCRRHLVPLQLLVGLLAAVAFSAINNNQTFAADAHSHILRDDAPAKSWDVGYPVGNGRLGATAFGGFDASSRARSCGLSGRFCGGERISSPRLPAAGALCTIS